MLFAVDARLVALLLCSANVVALATRAGRVIALAGSSSSTSPPPLILSAGARSQCVVPATDGRSFPEYLLSRASDGPLLQLPRCMALVHGSARLATATSFIQAGQLLDSAATGPRGLPAVFFSRGCVARRARAAPLTLIPSL